MTFLKQLKVEPPYNPEIPLLGVYLDKNMIQKDNVSQCLFYHSVQ